MGTGVASDPVTETPPSAPEPPDPPAPPPPSSRARRLLALVVSAEARFLLLAPTAGPAGWFLRALQVPVLAARRYREDHAGDRAAALAFTTLLSLLPLVLLALAALGMVGVSQGTQEVVRGWLIRNMVPETAREVEGLLDRTLDSLQDASEGLGIVGLLSLVLVAWKLLATLDRTFQQVAGVDTLSSRLRRLAGFWVTVAAAPLLVAASILLSGLVETLAARGHLPVGALLDVFRYLLPLLPGWMGITLLYRFASGVKVPWSAALLGGAVAALLFEVLKAGFALYLRNALITRTVLSGMGVLPVFLLWIYLSWVLFLAGAELTMVARDYGESLRRSGIGPAPPPAG